MIKANPFYALSAVAMLLGCWLLSQALHLQAGQLPSLLVLMAVLQLYELLLVGLGTFLRRTSRGPRDGAAVLAIESAFLLDAPLLTTECVTTDLRMGTATAGLLAVMGMAKLLWVRRSAPDLLSLRTSRLLGAHMLFVLLVPAAAAQLAAARAFGPLAFYAFWWATAALPAGRRALFAATQSSAPPVGSRAHAVWTYVPAAMALLHLWGVGYIHGVAFSPAFLAPILLGMAATAGRQQLVRRVALPAMAALVSLGQGAALGFPLSESGGPFGSPARIALLGAAVTWGYLAWRDRERWLGVLALGSAPAGLLGAAAPHVSGILTRGLRGLGALVPRDAFGWGVLTIIAAFVFLAAGARRSLRSAPRAAAGKPAAGALLLLWRPLEATAIALVLCAFALCAARTVGEGSSFSYAQRQGTAVLACFAVGAALLIALRAYRRASRQEGDPPDRRLARLTIAASAFAFIPAAAPLAPPGHGQNESMAVGDLRTVMAAQSTYRTLNGGFFDSRLECLSAPAHCIPGHSGDDGAWILDPDLASQRPRRGYLRLFAPGPPVERRPPGVSPSSTLSFAYTAVPIDPGYSGTRGFCGDSTGVICTTDDGTTPRLRPDGTCDLTACRALGRVSVGAGSPAAR